uniref:hypothetical protein n=1 Tax=Tetragenococcus halophilus TaxID=51669 RepID=UPI00207669DE|nr:hypothetical protein [Tetragenococcus halophilus]
MDLDFKSNKYDLFDDWHQNKTKQAFTQKLQQQAFALSYKYPFPFKEFSQLFACFTLPLSNLGR